MKIAIFVNENDEILPFYMSGVVEIYADQELKWKCLSRISFDMTVQRDLVDIQLKTKWLISKIDDCQLLIVEDIKGLPLAILNDSGIAVWKMHGVLSINLLEFTKAKCLEALKKEKKKTIQPVLKGKAADAEYEINLISMLRENSVLNSIDVLVPFIQNTNFKKLQITCSHIPLWFGEAMKVFRLNSSYEVLSFDTLKVTVNPLDINADISFRKQIRIFGKGGCSCGG